MMGLVLGCTKKYYVTLNFKFLKRTLNKFTLNIKALLLLICINSAFIFFTPHSLHAQETLLNTHTTHTQLTQAHETGNSIMQELIALEPAVTTLMYPITPSEENTGTEHITQIIHALETFIIHAQNIINAQEPELFSQLCKYLAGALNSLQSDQATLLNQLISWYGVPVTDINQHVFLFVFIKTILEFLHDHDFTHKTNTHDYLALAQNIIRACAQTAHTIKNNATLLNDAVVTSGQKIKRLLSALVIIMFIGTTVGILIALHKITNKINTQEGTLVGQHVRDYEQLRASVQEQARLAEQERLRLQERLAQLNTEQERLRVLLSAQEQVHETEREQVLAQLRTREHTQVSEYERLRTQLNALEQAHAAENETLRSQLGALATEQEHAREQLGTLTQTSTTERERINTQLAVLATEQERARAQLGVLEQTGTTEHDRINTQLAALTTEQEHARAQLGALERIQTDTSQQLRTHITEQIARCMTEIQRESQTITNLQQQLQALNQAHQQLTVTLTNTDQRITGIDVRVTSQLSQNNAQLEQMRATFIGQIQTAQRNLATMVERFNEYLASMGSYAAEINSLDSLYKRSTSWVAPLLPSASPSTLNSVLDTAVKLIPTGALLTGLAHATVPAAPAVPTTQDLAARLAALRST